MTEQTPQAEPRPAPKNPPPFRLRGFGHRDVTVDGVRYEIHPGTSFRDAVKVYQRTKTGQLRRVKNPGAARAVVNEFNAQRRRADELQEAAKRQEADRKPVVLKKPSLKWRLRRWVRIRWQALRVRLRTHWEPLRVLRDYYLATERIADRALAGAETAGAGEDIETLRQEVTDG